MIETDGTWDARSDTSCKSRLKVKRTLVQVGSQRVALQNYCNRTKTAKHHIYKLEFDFSCKDATYHMQKFTCKLIREYVAHRSIMPRL